MNGQRNRQRHAVRRWASDPRILEAAQRARMSLSEFYRRSCTQETWSRWPEFMCEFHDLEWFQKWLPEGYAVARAWKELPSDWRRESYAASVAREVARASARR